MRIKTFSNAPVFSALQGLAVTIQTGAESDILAHIMELTMAPEFRGPAWQASFLKLAHTVATGAPTFSIYAMGGNSKLPFVAFSSLPGVTCPGAGQCLDFCYSFRAWRYPAAFARMAQNAFLMRFHPNIIRAEFASIAAERADGFDFRLYVDGDFSSIADVEFWMSTLRDNPSARAYGYSKSFEALLGYSGGWPSNYMLNLSSGHNSGPGTLDLIRALPVTRGEFRAVSIGRKVKASDHGTAENNASIRAALPNEKVFPCPGKCGTCTGKGHACGMPQLKGRIIAIAIH